MMGKWYFIDIHEFLMKRKGYSFVWKPLLYKNLKLLKCQCMAYQFHADFKNVFFCMLILPIFRVMAISWPKKARFLGFRGKRAFFSLEMAMTRKICKLGILKYNLSILAWNSASIGMPYIDIWVTSNKGFQTKEYPLRFIRNSWISIKWHFSIIFWYFATF